jgi:hypothetical protein
VVLELHLLVEMKLESIYMNMQQRRTHASADDHIHPQVM